ncbi:MAG: HAD hydrolase-like protein [Candidatus Zixiibacteriota bacterium]|nr:MAG: HAD hydrolase-like protein [candidate division Zixibacteria bacterium]
MQKHSHLLLDIEGTIVLDKRYTPVPGSVRWFNSLAKKGVKARLVTNNTTESPDHLYDILRKRGFKFARDDFFTCLTVALARMKRNPAKGGAKSCLVFGKQAVKKYLRQNGIKPMDSKNVDAVLIGHDPTVTYKKLNTAVGAIIENGAKLYTLHRNRRFVDENREIVMSSGPIAKALENACLVRASLCGKPDRRFYLSSIKGWDVERSEILMVSDDPFADLIGAKKIGMKTCWVLTGSQKDRNVVKKIAKKYHPDYILDSVTDIPG